MNRHYTDEEKNQIVREYMNASPEVRADMDKRATSLNHTGADLARIIGATNEFAWNNPTASHITYIVSFQTRMVTELRVQGGHVSVIEKGIVQKRSK